ncbi:hypothetical protein E3N88_35067 [Mikania micrantha]|uniref:CCHC-type domain-containing protein n=1 Tax=Mikania micrantha TaxID=192012 RepID=A0A5N6LZY2_9ASTR|nr:hypothetical protein E3N88_35067 [Mikania micrantha]
MFAGNLLKDRAKDWWELLRKERGKDGIKGLTWAQFKELFLKRFCPQAAIDRIAEEFLHLQQKDESIDTITAIVFDKAKFCPDLLQTERMWINRYHTMLNTKYREFLTPSKCETLNELINCAREQELELKRQEDRGDKRKAETDKGSSKNAKFVKSSKKSVFTKPCPNCGRMHAGECRARPVVCYKCGKPGHLATHCLSPPSLCYNCYKPGHRRSECPELKRATPINEDGRSFKSQGSGKKLEAPKPKGRAFQISAEEAKVTSDVVTDTFFVNSIPAYVLFDSGANPSFVSIKFVHHPSFVLEKLSVSLEVEVVDSKSFLVFDIYRNWLSSINITPFRSSIQSFRPSIKRMEQLIANTTTSFSDATIINLGTDHRQVVPITLFVAVLCLCLVVGHLLDENRWVNESITAIIIGCVVGTIILCTSKWKSSKLLRFDEELFFIYLLPPIIFNAGFSVKKKQFFHNFIPIMLFGVTGVFISTSIVAAGCWWLFPKLGLKGLTFSEYLSIGTIFSSTDTVCTLQVLHQDETPLLYSLVFGEGVVNDATSVVLFNAVRKITANTFGGKAALRIVLDFLYLFFTSTVLGVTVITITLVNRHSSVREISLMILIAYLSYMLAELCELSGILTVFFAGVLMSHYAWHNVTESSRITTRHAFAAFSFIAETFIFLYVGMDALDYEKWKMSTLSFWTSIGIYNTVLMLLLLGRAAFVFPLSFIANYMNKGEDPSSKITRQHQEISAPSASLNTILVLLVHP